MKKSYFLRTSYLNERTGNINYELIDRKTATRVPFYTEYLMDLCLNHKHNSVDAAANDLAVFLSYIDVASSFDFSGIGELSTPLKEIIESYPKFLIEGKGSDSGIARYAATILSAKPRKPTSANRMLSSASSFLTASADFYKYTDELKDLGLIDIDVPRATYLDTSSHRVKNKAQAKMINHKSAIAACISGGVKYVTKAYYSGFTTGAESKVDKAFPEGFIIQAISNATSDRDRALWSLMAGTGIRHSEAAQLLVDDVDFINKTVTIINPKTRYHRYPAPYNTSKSLAFKYRAHSKTYFLEPFKTMFFESVKSYIRNERLLQNHDVLFVSLANSNRGKPWYACTNTSHNKTFKPAATSAGAVGYTVHSLRHLYAVYIVNYVETSEGDFGFALEIAKHMIGHGDIESTKEYAILDDSRINRAVSKFTMTFSADVALVRDNRHEMPNAEDRL